MILNLPSHVRDFARILSAEYRQLVAPPTGDRTAVRMVDGLTIGILFSVSFALYGTLSFRLAEGKFFSYYNLAFDFDSYRVFSLLTETNPDKLGVKHPLMMLIRPMGQALMAVGLPPEAAAATVMSAVGAGTVTLVWLFMRTIGLPRRESMLLALLYSVTGTQIYVAAIPETYGFSAFLIALTWLIAAKRMLQPDALPRLKYAASVMTAGVTLTNMSQSVFAEWTASRARKPYDTLLLLLAFLTVTATVFGILCILVWPSELWAAAQDPILALKKIWWLQTKGEKSSALAVVQSFLAYSFVTPDWTLVPLPETTVMRDFRLWNYSTLGGVAVWAWLLFWVIGAACMLRQKNTRRLALGLVVALAFNLLLHMQYQFRESVFIYAAHAHFPAFALASGAAFVAMRYPLGRAVYCALLILVTAATAANNIPQAIGFSSSFDTLQTECPAPCANGN